MVRTIFAFHPETFDFWLEAKNRGRVKDEVRRDEALINWWRPLGQCKGC